MEPSASFEEFYLREFRAVVGLAYALSGSRAGAEDLAQEAFPRRIATGTASARTTDPMPGSGGWWRTSPCRRSGAARSKLARSAGLSLGQIDAMPALSNDDDEFWHAVRGLPRRQTQTIALHSTPSLTRSEGGNSTILLSLAARDQTPSKRRSPLGVGMRWIHRLRKVVHGSPDCRRDRGVHNSCITSRRHSKVLSGTRRQSVSAAQALDLRVRLALTRRRSGVRLPQRPPFACGFRVVRSPGGPLLLPLPERSGGDAALGEGSSPGR